MIIKKSSVLFPASQKAFTIVELMIALTVLSTILIISSTVLISLGSIYIKGVNQSNTQNVARNVLNELVGQLQLGGAVPNIPATGKVFCLGSQRYTYKLDYKLDGADDKSHVLWRDTMNNSATCVPLDITVPNPHDSSTFIAGSELVSANMRLTELLPQDNGDGTYTVKLTVAYGGDGTNTISDLVQVTGATTRCQGGQGNQYCAVSALSQTITNRGVN